MGLIDRDRLVRGDRTGAIWDPVWISEAEGLEPRGVSEWGFAEFDTADQARTLIADLPIRASAVQHQRFLMDLEAACQGSSVGAITVLQQPGPLLRWQLREESRARKQPELFVGGFQRYCTFHVVGMVFGGDVDRRESRRSFFLYARRRPHPKPATWWSMGPEGRWGLLHAPDDELLFASLSRRRPLRHADYGSHEAVHRFETLSNLAALDVGEKAKRMIWPSAKPEGPSKAEGEDEPLALASRSGMWLAKMSIRGGPHRASPYPFVSTTGLGYTRFAVRHITSVSV